MKCIKIMPSTLKGEISVPPSKSISHRMLICAGFCSGKSILKNIAFSEDIRATIKGVEVLGAKAEYLAHCINRKTNDIAVTGNNRPLIRKETVIECGESASTLRFLIPLASLTGGEVTFTGRGNLPKRPLDVYLEIFDKQGIRYKIQNNNNNNLPLTLCGSINPGEYQVRGDISSQFISGLMFALPLLEGDSRIEITAPLESRGYIDLTIDTLKKFSIVVENRDYEEFFIKGCQEYKAANCCVEGDFSQAAFWLAAGALGAEIWCMNIDTDSLQGDRFILDIISKMGGNLVYGKGFIKAEGTSFLLGITVDASECPDLVPVVAVLGALSSGTTKIVNAKRLRLKETDRLNAISTELNKLGAKISELPDGLIIKGRETLRGGAADSRNDHRIAMALAIASTRCRELVVIKNSEAVNKSYPGFWDDFVKVGGVINELDNRQ